MGVLCRRAGGEGGDGGWASWMASPTRWTWVWANSGRQWRTGKPGVLQSTGSQTLGHNLATEQQPQITAGRGGQLAILRATKRDPQGREWKQQAQEDAQHTTYRDVLRKMYTHSNLISHKKIYRDFPCGPVTKTQCSQCRGHGVWSLVRELDPTGCN